MAEITGLSKDLDASKEFFGIHGNFKARSKDWEKIDKELQVIDSVDPKTLDLTSQSDVAIFLLQSKDIGEWNERTNQIKSANGGNYPNFYSSVVYGVGGSPSAGASNIMNIHNITEKRWKVLQNKDK